MDVCLIILEKSFRETTIQYKNGTTTGKNPGIPLLRVAKKTKTPAKIHFVISILGEIAALNIISTAQRVKIPIVFSCMLLEYDQKQIGIVIQRIMGNHPSFLIASFFL